MDRDEFFQEIESSPRREPFTLPSGKKVFVVEISALDLLQARLESLAESKGDEKKADELFGGRLAVRSVVDEKNELVFKPADAERLMRGKSRIVTALTDLVYDVAGLGSDVKKNSEHPPT